MAVLSSDPPELLLLGEDAVEGFRATEETRRAEVDAWEQRSSSTQFAT